MNEKELISLTNNAISCMNKKYDDVFTEKSHELHDVFLQGFNLDIPVQIIKVALIKSWCEK